MNWENNYQHFKKSSQLESSATAEKRENAFNNFLLTGLPTKREEAWRFTSLNNFKDINWKLHGPEAAALTHEQMQEISKLLPSNFINFVFVNGILDRTLSDDADNLLAIAPLVQNDFTFAESSVEDRLLNLSQAFLNKKINLTVPKHKVMEQPIQIVFVQSTAVSVFQSDRLNIILEENSEAKIIINSISFVNSTADALNMNVNVNIEKSAKLQFVQLQNENQESFHFSQCRFVVESSAVLTSLVLSLGNKLVRNYYHLKFVGENAFASVYGLGVLDQLQHLDNYTFFQHAVGHNQSHQHYKSILSGSARSAFRGRVLIEVNAQKAISQQLNNNLLLTRSAQADSVPQLEIYADDVKAGHGATFGQLNKDEIFYLLTRGISQYQAVKMLSFGFAKEIILKIDDVNIQNYLISAFNQKLESMVQDA